MIRRLNYTGRVKIRRDDVAVQIQELDGQPTVTASTKLGEYAFPDEAMLFLEAYRQTTWMRFPFGTVGNPATPDTAREILSEFDGVEGILFRLKVTQPGERPVLLGVADRVSSGQPDERVDRDPLLPVVPSNLGDELWRIDLTDEPRLLVNRSAVSDWRQLAASPIFVALIYPAVLRQILETVIINNQHRDVDDDYDWQSRWLKFAILLPGVDRQLPERQDESAARMWIDDAVVAFAHRLELAKKFVDAWQPLGDH